MHLLHHVYVKNLVCISSNKSFKCNMASLFKITIYYISCVQYDVVPHIYLTLYLRIYYSSLIYSSKCFWQYITFIAYKYNTQTSYGIAIVEYFHLYCVYIPIQVCTNCDPLWDDVLRIFIYTLTRQRDIF